MNENVKIKINEVDKTSPTGVGIDSTDIVFIPGFSKLTTAPSVPTLCQDVATFEKEFGEEPYTLTETDVTGYTTYGFVADTVDGSYVMAKQLLLAGMSVVYVALPRTEGDKCLDAFYKDDTFENILDLIADKSIYNVKYITSGAYPSVVSGSNGAVSMFATQMLSTAATRGDAVALIDYQKDSELLPFSLDQDSFYKRMNSLFATLENTEFGSAMYPWANYDCFATVTDTTVCLPASYAYLNCLAKAIKASPNWLAMAGVSRGIVPGLDKRDNVTRLCVPNGVLSNTVAEEMQPKFGADGQRISINCITDVRPYGLTLWGNRTLKPLEVSKGTVALNFLNTRNMISDIKKILYTTAKSLMFEQNTDALWIRFKAGVSPVLNQLKAGNGISDYKIIKSNKKYNGDALTRGEIAAVIKIYPIYAVEYFELTVEISDEDVVVS